MNMMRKHKASPSNQETGLARATSSSSDWFAEKDPWFDDFRRSFEERFWGPLGPGTETWLRVREPLVDLIDQGSEFVVRAKLPGVAKEDVNLNVTADRIEICAETDRSREAKEKNYHFQERTYQALHRVLCFPEEVRADLASATLKEGVLEIRIPKQEPNPESKPAKVPIE